MKLANKNLLYSIALAGAVGVFIISYLLLMLPSLYTAYKREANYNDFKNSFIGYIESEGNSSESIPTKSVGIKIPLDGYIIELSNNSFVGRVEIKDKDLKGMFDKIRFSFKNNGFYESNKNKLNDIGKEFEDIIEKLKGKFSKGGFADSDVMSVHIEYNSNSADFSEGHTRFNRLGKSSFIVESSVKDVVNKIDYTTFLGVSKGEKYYFIEMAAAVAPSVTDIIPVIFSMLPVIIPVIILLIFITSGLYSKNIVKPITLLWRDAEGRRGGKGHIEPIAVKGNDEIAELAHSLNLLYKSQEEAYDKLNKEGERKEIFMRAFSHQLKTPVAAATLLADGMISNVGKFADRDKYLPELKKQLLTVKQMTDEILRINHISENIAPVNIDAKDVVIEALNSVRTITEAGNIKTCCEGGGVWYCDPYIFEQILLNLVGNAAKYTDNGGEIRAVITDKSIKITNHPAHIDESIKDSLFEAFVTGEGSRDGHGLGLYVARYFAELLGMKLDFESVDDKVTFTLTRKEEPLC